MPFGLPLDGSLWHMMSTRAAGQNTANIPAVAVIFIMSSGSSSLNALVTLTALKLRSINSMMHLQAPLVSNTPQQGCVRSQLRGVKAVCHGQKRPSILNVQACEQGSVSRSDEN
jgi:hypothetical protein